LEVIAEAAYGSRDIDVVLRRAYLYAVKALVDNKQLHLAEQVGRKALPMLSTSEAGQLFGFFLGAMPANKIDFENLLSTTANMNPSAVTELVNSIANVVETLTQQHEVDVTAVQTVIYNAIKSLSKNGKHRFHQCTTVGYSACFCVGYLDHARAFIQHLFNNAHTARHVTPQALAVMIQVQTIDWLVCAEHYLKYNW
jgi:hypothetical protein